MKKTLRFILKVVIGIIIWLILTDIQRTYFGGQYIANLIVILFGVSLLSIIKSEIIYFKKRKKKNKFKFVHISAPYLLCLLIGMFFVNIVYKNIAEHQFIALLKGIDSYRVENGYLPKKLEDLPNNYFNIYGVIPHQFIYEPYTTFIEREMVFDERNVVSQSEMIIGFKTPFNSTKYRISENENFMIIIQELSGLTI